MAGVSADGFEGIGGFAEVEQSIGKILTTHVGERVHREYFGNPGLDLLGKDITEATILRFYAICWALIDLYEPRVRIQRFIVDEISRDGMLNLQFELEFREFAHLDFVQSTAFVSIADGVVRIEQAT